MPAPAADFRTFAFDTGRVDAAAKSVGRDPYWKMYAAENIVRVVVNSILSAQVGSGWWTVAVDPKIQGRVTSFKARYAANPWYGSPGRHEIYFTFLSDLAEIMRANAHLFLPAVPDIDAWVARIDQVVIPRNVVGHMNWPTKTDRKRIDVFHSDVKALAAELPLRGVQLRTP